MQPSSEHPRAPSLAALFSYPFRIFFLSLAVLAIVSIPLWVIEVSGVSLLPLALPGLFWHQHEMLFGFLSAGIAGFLLTAVCVWTGTEAMHGRRLVLLWLVWLAGRLTLALGEGLPGWLVHTINLSFLPLVMLDAGWRIWRAKQSRQFMILLVLGLLWIMQAGFVTQLDTRFIHGALVLALALIGIIGGRITPAFTSGWLKRQGLKSNDIRMMPSLDMASVISLILLTLAVALGLPLVSGILALVAAALMLIRLAGWKGWRTYQEPLLWMLHLSILWVPVALILLAGTQFFGWPSNVWAHAAGTGAIGCLIMGVIPRVSLGHTGRALILPSGIFSAFIAIHLAALIRVLTAAGLIPWHPGIGLSTLLWIIAYGLFLIRYSAILASPRAPQ